MSFDLITYVLCSKNKSITNNNNISLKNYLLDILIKSDDWDINKKKYSFINEKIKHYGYVYRIEPYDNNDHLVWLNSGITVDDEVLNDNNTINFNYITKPDSDLHLKILATNIEENKNSFIISPVDTPIVDSMAKTITKYNFMPQGNNEKAGLNKLYNTMGQNTDGSISQQAVSNELNEKVEMQMNQKDETLILDHNL